MAKKIPSWSELNQATKQAIARRELSAAERLLVSLWREARQRDERELIGNTHFTEGLLRDAQSQLAESEAAFQAALQIDIELHGKTHVSVSDTLHSLGIIRSRRGDDEGALTAYRQAVEIHRTVQKFQLTRRLNILAGKLLAMERYEPALDAFTEAFARAKNEPLTPVQDAASALLGAGEALRRSKRFPEALSRFAMATQLGRPKMWPELTACMARAWYNLAIVSRYALQSCAAMAAVAYWYAATLSNAVPELHEKATSALSELPEKVLAHGDPNDFRLVYADAQDNVHVASAQRGLFYFKGKVDAALGEVVKVTLEGYDVKQIERSARGGGDSPAGNT